MILLPWRAKPGKFAQVIRLSWEKGSPLGLHTHQYPELFWIDEGRCRHLVNGGEDILEKGSLVFVRAKDRHQLFAVRGGGFTMTNIELHPSLLRDLMHHHRESFALWFGGRQSMPMRLALTPAQLDHLQHLIRDFASLPPDRLQSEGFCLDLARLLTPRSRSATLPPDCPGWLREALVRIQSPDVFPEGPSALHRLAGRSPEHVARLCRKYTGHTPTAIIEHCRMLYAEQRLRLTSHSITEIALECGYSTTAQFHRAFKQHYRRTPLRYRRWIRGA